MYKLSVRDHIDAAHRIDDYQGRCQQLHGHRWEVEVVVEGRKLDGLNMLVDFVVVKRALKDLLGQLDHHYLNDVLDERNLTAEHLAGWLWDKLKKEGVMKVVELKKVKVWESPECCVSYYEEG